VCKIVSWWSDPPDFSDFDVVIRLHLPPSLQELTLLFRPCRGFLPFNRSNLIATFENSLAPFVARGGRLTLVGLDSAPFYDAPKNLLRAAFHNHIAATRSQANKNETNTYGSDRFPYLHVALEPADEALKDNTNVITWDEWRAGAPKLELDWFDADWRFDPDRYTFNDGWPHIPDI
jgi:hypothetical protein